MYFKPDWERAKERILAWWAGEIIDRPVILVTSPRKGIQPVRVWDTVFPARCLDRPERAVTEWENYCEATFFGGEMPPNFWVNLGPGSPATFFGAIPHIGQDTIWFEPPGDLSWQEILALQFEEENEWWAATKKITETVVQAGRGKYLTGMIDLNSVFNILCHLRGTQRLLVDLIEHPDEVKQACGLIKNVWIDCFDELNRIIQQHQEGITNWMNLWYPGRMCDVQCDFSAMISPAMFEEFVLDHLAEQSRAFDKCIYHMDGPGQIPHFEILLDMAELDGIQWIPGAGNDPVSSPRWFPMYRRILERDKRLVLLGMDVREVESVLREIPSRGLLIRTTCDSEEQARHLLNKVEQWTRD